VLNVGRVERARIVDEDVHAAERLGGGLDAPLDRFGLTQITGLCPDDAAMAARRRDGCGQPFRATRHSNDVSAMSRRANRNGGADPAAGAGHQRSPTCEVERAAGRRLCRAARQGHLQALPSPAGTASPASSRTSSMSLPDDAVGAARSTYREKNSLGSMTSSGA